VIERLDCKTLKKARLINSRWLYISNPFFNNLASVTFETELNLERFNSDFENRIDFPLNSFTFSEELLASESSRRAVQNFSNNYGRFVRRYHLVHLSSNNIGVKYYDKRTSFPHNICSLFQYARNLEEIIVKTTIPMECLKLSSPLPPFSKLRKVYVGWESLQHHAKKSNSLLLELSKVPGLSSFAFMESNMEEILTVLKNQQQNSPSAVISLPEIKIFDNTPDVEQLLCLIESGLKFAELKFYLGRGGSCTYMWSRVSNLVASQNQSLKTFYIRTCDDVATTFEIPTLEHLKELRLGFKSRLSPISHGQFPNLKVLEVCYCYFHLFSSCDSLDSVTRLILRLIRRRRLQFSPNEGWHRLLPNVTSLDIFNRRLGAKAFQAAFRFQDLLHLKMSHAGAYPVESWILFNGCELVEDSDDEQFCGNPLPNNGCPCPAGEHYAKRSAIPSLKDLKRKEFKGSFDSCL